MKYFLISDNNDTLAGMRLTGVSGIVVHEEKELYRALQNARAQSDIGLVLVSEKLCRQYRELLLDFKMRCPCPLIVEMPDRHSGDDVGEALRREIAEAVGIKI
ncbi:MAG: V-type ATP synthase subunit F [Oscillospiraceae bacterium]|jgi:V/A-type H+-transporting ATPase subunit F|nr:V-type ATP synthase subunit F [Oscillospiraceae bacterium]